MCANCVFFLCQRNDVVFLLLLLTLAIRCSSDHGDIPDRSHLRISEFNTFDDYRTHFVEVCMIGKPDSAADALDLKYNINIKRFSLNAVLNIRTIEI